MPSFIVHSIVGRELSKRLNLDSDDYKKFFIANLLPDVKQSEFDNNMSDALVRQTIQKEKRTTHFRNNFQEILEYPNLDLFLEKYESLVKEDLIVFGYFFHLYTDYYYFSTFLPGIITFLDEDYKETLIKENDFYVKINRTGKILSTDNFWSKKNTQGIYQDYSRLNKYLIDKYNFNYDFDSIKKYLDSNKFDIKIEEINSKNLMELLEQLDYFYMSSINSSEEEFIIFDTESIDKLIDAIISSFTQKYSYLFSNFIK